MAAMRVPVTCTDINLRTPGRSAPPSGSREVVLSVPDLRSTPHPLQPLTSGDAGVVARIRAGDEATYESLYLEYHESLWRFAYTLVRSAEIAEELVQDIFLALWRDRARWRVTTSIRLWLYGAVRNRAMNHRRHERVVAMAAVMESALDEGERPAGMGAPPIDPQAALEASELDERVDRALALVSERRRIAMTLRWRHQFTPSEIAEVLGTTPEAVRVLLVRARQDLEALVQDEAV